VSALTPFLCSTYLRVFGQNWTLTIIHVNRYLCEVC